MLLFWRRGGGGDGSVRMLQAACNKEVDCSLDVRTSELTSNARIISPKKLLLDPAFPPRTLYGYSESLSPAMQGQRSGLPASHQTTTAIHPTESSV